MSFLTSAYRAVVLRVSANDRRIKIECWNFAWLTFARMGRTTAKHSACSSKFFSFGERSPRLGERPPRLFHELFPWSSKLHFSWFLARFPSVFSNHLYTHETYQNTIKLEDFTTVQVGKCEWWVSNLLTHHTPKLKPLLVLKQQSSNKCFIIPFFFMHDRNNELIAKM